MKPLIIFYDGPCVFCNYWVKQLCQWDKNDALRFSSLDRPLFQAFINERNLDTSTFESVVAWDQNYSYAIESQAVFMVFQRLGGGWKILNFFSYLPTALTNFFYRIIARNRYKWFGKLDACPLPDPKYYQKFLD